MALRQFSQSIAANSSSLYIYSERELVLQESQDGKSECGEGNQNQMLDRERFESTDFHTIVIWRLCGFDFEVRPLLQTVLAHRIWTCCTSGLGFAQGLGNTRNKTPHLHEWVRAIGSLGWFRFSSCLFRCLSRSCSSFTVDPRLVYSEFILCLL